MKCLLVASIFPPINGGSAVVYESICRFSPPGSMLVLAPWRHYLSGELIQGWREHDAAAPYPVYRLELLRPTMVEARSWLHSLWLLVSVDLPLKYRVLREVTRLVRGHGVNVVCVGELTSGSWIGLYCQRWLGCKMVNYIHGEEVTTVSPYRFYGRGRRRYLHAADGVVAVSNFTRQALIDLMDVDPAKIELIENGVDAERFTPGPKRADLLARYGLDGKRILVTVGRLVERKGIDMTLRALPRIVDALPDVHYLIVGDGEYRPTLERIVRELGLRENVTFAGRVPVEELVDHYRLCDLFVMPNRELSDHDTEGFGLVFLEANACGKAVVGGRAGGAVEAVREGENGLLVDGADPAEIARAVTRLLSDDEFRRGIERRGLEIAQRSASGERAQRFHALCKRLVGEA
jgi:phosphatidylinositol alpha-1,6-mannosyltransferase